MNFPGSKHPFLFLAPGMALLLAFSFLPLADTIFTSFTNAKLILPRERFSGLANYQAVLTDGRFWHSLSLTLLYTLVSTSLEAILGLSLGILMNRLSPRNSFLRILLFIPWVIPTVVTARTWQWMFDYNLGIINYFLEALALQRTNWLGDPFLAFFSLVIADVWKTTPFVAIIILAGLSALPPEIYQSSIIDGAGAWQRFRFITLPLILPVWGVAILFRAIDALRIFDLVYVLTGGGPGGSTETLSVYAYKLFFYKGDFGQGAATSVIIMSLVAVFSYFYTKKSRERNFM